MPRVNLSDLDNYGSNGSYSKVNYLQLKNDGDKASVRFMLEDIEDLNDYIYVTHTVKPKSLAEKMKYGVQVNCLREYNDPIDECPLCAAGLKTAITICVPLYNNDSDQVEVWTRGKTFASKLSKLMNRYKDFPSHSFDIERNGAKGSKETTYEIYETDDDDMTLEDLPEVPEMLGSVIWDKTAEDMEYYLSEQDFPPTESEEDEEEEPPRRRRSSRNVEQEEQPRRRNRRPPSIKEDEEEAPWEEDEEEEQPKRRQATGGRKARRRTAEEEF